MSLCVSSNTIEICTYSPPPMGSCPYVCTLCTYATCTANHAAVQVTRVFFFLRNMYNSQLFWLNRTSLHLSRCYSHSNFEDYCILYYMINQSLLLRWLLLIYQCVAVKIRLNHWCFLHFSMHFFFFFFLQLSRCIIIILAYQQSVLVWLAYTTSNIHGWTRAWSASGKHVDTGVCLLLSEKLFHTACNGKTQ